MFNWGKRIVTVYRVSEIYAETKFEANNILVPF